MVAFMAEPPCDANLVAYVRQTEGTTQMSSIGIRCHDACVTMRAVCNARQTSEIRLDQLD